jgi:hypothetical protein
MKLTTSGFEDADDELKASNEVLKLKLEVEHGMKTYEAMDMSPELEHQWLNYIYQHEQLHKTCGRIKVYDYIGRPRYTPVEELRKDSITAELERLLAIMTNHGIQLDCIREYDDSVIYRFMTTELFAEEIDNIRMPGLIHHFTYEEYHMNNEYEIERIGIDLIKSIYNHEWRAEYDSIWLSSSVKCNGINQDFMGFSGIITGFQMRHSFLEIKNLDIVQVSVDPDGKLGTLRATISYLAQSQLSNDQQLLKGDCEIRYRKDPDSGDWSITDLLMPGIMGISS